MLVFEQLNNRCRSKSNNFAGVDMLEWIKRYVIVYHYRLFLRKTDTGEKIVPFDLDLERGICELNVPDLGS